INHRSLPFSDEADILSVLTEIGSILRSLALIGQRLKNDEPLKPALFLFVWVNKLTRDLVAHINNRLARFPDETVDLFNSLDAASYTVSIELKKVFNQELSGLLSMRPATSVYARFETAYALLTDSFLQVLAGFAVLVDPAVSTYDLFPNFQMRLDKSLKLRKHLWQILERVRKAESGTEKSAADELIKDLMDFQSTSLGLLYFKDTETVERFCEEIIGTRNSKDLNPLLHRFGAYLETLFGQVNMRSVLASHPFTGEAQ
ncbi:MAG: hypothetical protein ABI539_00385, partial [Acidobacteriota bacterium]